MIKFILLRMTFDFRIFQVIPFSYQKFYNICNVFPFSLHQSKPFPVAQYGGRFTVTMLPGDGIGPEMMSYVENIFRYVLP